MSKSPKKEEAGRIERLRERVGALEKERDEARQALDRATADREKQVQRVEEARRAVSEADQAYARALASSYREKEGEGEAAVADAKTALEDARRQLADAESEQARLTEAADLLRADLRKAEKRLAEGATEAKREAAEELIAEVRVAWGPVRTLLGDVRAITSVPHGDNPPSSRYAEAASERFERSVFEGKPPTAAAPVRGPTPGRGALGSLLSLLGGAGLIAGAFLEWLTPFKAAGVDLEFRAFYQQAFFEGTRANRPSAGMAVIVVGVLAVGAAVFRRSWLAGLAGVLGVAAFALYAATVAGTEELSFPGEMGVGPWLVLVGGILVMAAAWFFAAGPRAAPSKGGGGTGTPPRRSWRPWRRAGEAAGGSPSPGGSTAGNPGPKHNPHGQEGGGEVQETRALERARRARLARVVVILAILIAFIVVVTQNSQPVEFRVITAEFHPPLIWVVVVSAVLGMVVGYLVGRPRKSLRP